MLSVKDRGSTRSGKSYLPDYIERIPDTRLEEFITNFQNSNTIDINSINTLMSRMTISGKPEETREKTLGEYGAPSRHYLSSPIKFAEGPFIPLHPELIHKVDETAFQGKEGEDPHLHIATFVELCTALKPINVDLDSMMLKIFHFSLKGKALEWF